MKKSMTPLTWKGHAFQSSTLCLLLSITLLSCNPATSPETGTCLLSLANGSELTGYQDSWLTQPVVVRVTDERLKPQADITLTATVTAGGGSIGSSRAVTDENGEAQIAWRLGSDYSNEITIAIQEEDNAVTCRATARYLYAAPPHLSDGWDTAALDTSLAGTKSLLTAVDHIRAGIYTEIHSMLVISRSTLMLETYFPGHNSNGELIQFTRETPHEVQSASKSFRSALIGIAIDKGYIAGEQTAMASLFPEYAYLATAPKNGITLEDVLTMSSGLDWDEWGYPYGHSLNTLSTMYSQPATQWASFVLSRPMAHEPGSTFVYNTGASIMLNQIITNAIDISFNSFVSRHYASLCESSRLPGVGYPLGGATTPRDMAKLGAVFLNDGKWKQTQIVSQSWVEKSIAPRFQFGNGDGYGYQWWTKRYHTSLGSYDSFYASGNGGQYIIVIKELDLVIVFTGGNFNSGELMNQPFEIVADYIIPAFQ